MWPILAIASNPWSRNNDTPKIGTMYKMALFSGKSQIPLYCTCPPPPPTHTLLLVCICLFLI